MAAAKRIKANRRCCRDVIDLLKAQRNVFILISIVPVLYLLWTDQFRAISYYNVIIYISVWCVVAGVEITLGMLRRRKIYEERLRRLQAERARRSLDRPQHDYDYDRWY
ncbi:hypothetical protein [Mesorhizobium marinum]|uniref:hypothetical protein n=1 Tax=Mesorhizobium marinum TaxID=3228790 RepID=UPI003465E1CD